MYLKLIFQDLSRPDADRVIAYAEAEINFRGIRNSHIQLVDVPVSGLCPRLELHFTDHAQDLADHFASLATGRPQLGEQYTHSLTLHDRTATLSDNLNAIIDRLEPTVQHHNFMVTALSYPVNGPFIGFVRPEGNEWPTQHPVPYYLYDPRAAADVGLPALDI